MKRERYIVSDRTLIISWHFFNANILNPVAKEALEEIEEQLKLRNYKLYKGNGYHRGVWRKLPFQLIGKYDCFHAPFYWYDKVLINEKYEAEVVPKDGELGVYFEGDIRIIRIIGGAEE